MSQCRLSVRQYDGDKTIGFGKSIITSMDEIIRFSSKPMRVFRIATLVLCCLLFVLLMVLVFNVYALIVGIVMLLLIAFIVWFLNRRSIVIKESEIVVVELKTWHIPSEDIVEIQCPSERRGIIVIQTKSLIVRSAGFLFLRGINEEKNRELVQKLSKLYRK